MIYDDNKKKSSLDRELFKSPKKGASPRKFSVYDITVNVLPVGVITVCLGIIEHSMYLLAPLFDSTLTIPEVYISKLPLMALTTCLSYLGTVHLTILVYILEAKRIPKVGGFIKIMSVLLLPFFTLLAIPMDVISLFCKNLGWKPIPHTDTTDIEHVVEGGVKSSSSDAADNE